MYNLDKSSFLDIIDRACRQFSIDSCKDYKQNINLAQIELDQASNLGIISTTCMTSSLSRIIFDKHWQKKFPEIDSVYKKKYDTEKSDNWDQKNNQAKVNKNHLDEKISNIKSVINNSDKSSEEKQKSVSELFDEIKKAFSSSHYDFLNEIKENIIANYNLDEEIKKVSDRHDEIDKNVAINSRETFIKKTYQEFIMQLSHSISSVIEKACGKGVSGSVVTPLESDITSSTIIDSLGQAINVYDDV